MFSDGHLEANLTRHQARWGFQPVLPADGDGAVRVEPTAGPWPRVSMRAADGRWLRVHSDRAPLDEAAQTLAHGTPGEPAPGEGLVCLVGAGCGYVLDVLTARAAATAKFLLLEPEPALTRLCLARRDWTDLIEAGRLMVLAGPTYDGRAEAWRLVDPAAPNPLILHHPVIQQARPEQVLEAARVVGQAVTGARANAEARRKFAGPYLLNTLRNLPIIGDAYDARVLDGCGQGRAAIVAAAGPTLNRNLRDLATVDAWRDRAILVAVDTALKPAIAAGIRPDYVVSLDPAPANARKLTGFHATADTVLVAEPSIDPRAFSGFHGRTALFKVSDTHQPWPWLNTLGIDVGRMRAWGSVLTTAFDLALRLGCDPIIFIGTDLAYTGGMPHCRDTMYEIEWAAAAINGITLPQVWAGVLAHAITTSDLHGEPTKATDTLLAFRDWMVAQTTGDTSRRFVNATGAGLLAGPRIEQRTVIDAVSELRAASPRADVLRRARPIGRLQEIDRIVSQLLSAPLASSSPGPEWLEFAAGSARETDLHAALAEARTRARGRAGRAPNPFVTATLEAQSSMQPTIVSSAAVADWCHGPTPSDVLPSGAVADFHCYRYLHTTARRLEHLATLGLPLRERRVFEVGAGVGDLTSFFLDRGCHVHATDARPLHVQLLRQRFADHPRVTADVMDLDPPPIEGPGTFEIVMCYGLLYHLSDPAAALTFLANACDDLLLLETIVGAGDAHAINPHAEDAALAGAAFSGFGCRPSRAWVMGQLRERFPHVYTTVTQPNHYEYPVDWTRGSAFARRAIFVASRQRLDNPLLTSELRDQQERH
jgi:hypothetical protein